MRKSSKVVCITERRRKPNSRTLTWNLPSQFREKQSPRFIVSALPTASTSSSLRFSGPDADLRLRAPRHFWRADGSVGLEPVPARDPRLPPVGTVLKRVYGERTIEVTVLATGFEFEGRSYPSLSLIAQRVTGTRWNGFHFFGLRKGYGR